LVVFHAESEFLASSRLGFKVAIGLAHSSVAGKRLRFRRCMIGLAEEISKSPPVEMQEHQSDGFRVKGVCFVRHWQK
jgi:hypothetical protein